ncbi:putative acyl-CoA transferase/carnitine dehydratase [Cupriavidus necator]|uniref:Putative acyl-CoA transferase/carnitine dehydratase n=1 Tax=Cupriavidus necator TaxID=106590 RepID=A0A1K0J3F8_CUPNE|nr:putative acyl-CoA transferase/carnitine dehydratase [Cupriavidus necator]
MSHLPLKGVRILDLTSVIMGPYATQMLAEYGADVIKLEPPEGDIMRGMGPHREAGMGPVFLNLNRGKRSLCLDLKSAQAAGVIRKAVASSDVFITNMRRKALEKLSLDWDTLRAHNSKLIYVFLSGFGEHGPDAGRPAYDDLIQGMVGLPELVSRANGGAPQYLPLNLADKTMGLFATQTVLAALMQQRMQGGAGQYIEIPMLETMAAFVLSDHLGASTFEPPVGPPGNPRLLSPYRRPYRTLDGWLSSIVYTNRHWEAFLRLVGAGDLWESDPRFRTMTSRTQHIDEVYAFVDRHLATRTTDAWIEALNAADIPAARAMGIDELIRDMERPERGVIHRYQDADGNWYRGLNPTARWSASPPKAGRIAPRLGEHSDEILQELGLDC